MEPKERQKPVRRVSAKEAAEDIRAGMSDKNLMAKYQLTTRGLRSLIQKLSEAGLVIQAEHHGRATNSADASPSPWKCPACGTAQTHEFDECPQCGIVATKFKGSAKIPAAITRSPESPAGETPFPYPLTSKEAERFDSPMTEEGRSRERITQESDLNAPLHRGDGPGTPADGKADTRVGWLRLLAGRLGIDMSLILGVIGCFFLFAGVFLPVVKLPFIGGVTLMQIGKVTGGVAGFAYFVLAITAISVVLILFKYYRWLWLTSLGSAAVLFYTFLQFRRGLYQTKTWIGSIFAGQAAPQFLENPQLRVLRDQMQQMMTLEIDWGWTILFAGSALLAAAALVATLRAPSLKRPNSI